MRRIARLYAQSSYLIYPKKVIWIRGVILVSDEKLLREISTEIDLFDDMLTSLIELLEEKSIITQEEWESKIKSKISKRKNLTDYRDIQFKKKEEV